MNARILLTHRNTHMQKYTHTNTHTKTHTRTDTNTPYPSYDSTASYKLTYKVITGTYTIYNKEAQKRCMRRKRLHSKRSIIMERSTHALKSSGMNDRTQLDHLFCSQAASNEALMCCMDSCSYMLSSCQTFACTPLRETAWQRATL